MTRAPGLAVLVLCMSCSFPGNGNGIGIDGGAPDAPPDAPPDAAPFVCPAPYTLTDHGCHTVPSTLGTRTWAAARTACQGLSGGDLPVIETAAESAYVASAVSPTSTQRVWLGLTGESTDGSTWSWIDGDTVAQKALSLWSVNQPASAAPSCAVVHPATGQWISRACTASLTVVCELPMP